MWAALNKKTQIVVGCVVPTATQEELTEIEKKYDLILMNVENSPAHDGNIFKDGKFYSVNKQEGK